MKNGENGRFALLSLMKKVEIMRQKMLIFSILLLTGYICYLTLFRLFLRYFASLVSFDSLEIH